MEITKSQKCFEGFVEYYKHDSQVTQTEMKFSLFRPKDKSEKFSGGLIWLSGLTCNEENFITKAGAQQYAIDHNLVIICPDTSPRGLDLPGEHENYDFGSGAGFYVDATTAGYKDHYKMYTYINEEIYNFLNTEFNLNNNISIFGHSMGGHGALMIGLKNSKKYKSISAFSPIVNPMNCQWGQKAFKGYLGNDESQWSNYDACALIEEQDKHHLKPILIDQGLNDQFYPEQLLTQNFEKTCVKKDQELLVNYCEGYDHSYYFISSFIKNHIDFHAKHLS